MRKFSYNKNFIIESLTFQYYVGSQEIIPHGLNLSLLPPLVPWRHGWGLNRVNHWQRKHLILCCGTIFLISLGAIITKRTTNRWSQRRKNGGCWRETRLTTSRKTKAFIVNCSHYRVAPVTTTPRPVAWQPWTRNPLRIFTTTPQTIRNTYITTTRPTATATKPVITTRRTTVTTTTSRPVTRRPTVSRRRPFWDLTDVAYIRNVRFLLACRQLPIRYKTFKRPRISKIE